MNNEKQEQIIKGLVFTKNILDTITVTGFDNCSKLSTAYNNIEVLLNMIESREIEIAVKADQPEIKTKKTKG